jgi:hypothetical protein
MGFLWKKDSASKNLAILDKQTDIMRSSSSFVNERLAVLKQTNQLLDKAINIVDQSSNDKEKDSIRELKLDKKYENELVQKIDETKQNTLDTMRPLLQESKKLQANMVAAGYKAKQLMTTISFQRAVISEAKDFKETVEKIQKEGSENHEEIQKLVADVENINRLAKSTLSQYRKVNTLGYDTGDTTTASSISSELDQLLETVGQRSQ